MNQRRRALRNTISGGDRKFHGTALWQSRGVSGPLADNLQCRNDGQLYTEVLSARQQPQGMSLYIPSCSTMTEA